MTATPRGARKGGGAATTTTTAGPPPSPRSGRPALSARPLSHRSPSSSSLHLLLQAVFSVLLLVVALLAGRAEGVLEAKVGKPQAPPPPPEKTPPDDLYFFLTSKNPRRCFVLTEGKGSKFHVHYHFPAAKDGEKIALELRRLADDSNPKTRFMGESKERKFIEIEEGSHQFTIPSTKGMTFSLCAVTSNKTIKGRGLKLFLDLDTGKQNRTYDVIKKEFTLNDVQISMVQLKNSAQQMLRTADYSKELETVYHKLLLQLNREVLWWPVSQVVILIVMGFYQVRHLKKFFKSKRLV